MGCLVGREAVFLLVLTAICGACKGGVYKVGEAPGWTIIGNVDYQRWSSSKSFQVGDTIVFVYDPKYHSVLQVSRADYHSCNTMIPISIYTTGNDSIVIPRAGHYYYVCGFVGHCQAGQKVDIRVTKPDQPNKGPITSLVPSRDEPARPNPPGLGPTSRSPSSSSGESLMLCNGLLLFFVWAVELMRSSN